ncbi:MAG: T9SS type A sorting domain-containing protein [Saprospiraceae bacterium]|nr:T9SS type A sorting domain-containing protein [Saprospiraceae bacterium]
MKQFYLSFLFVLVATLGLSAQVYVKHDATGANNGSSWADAFTSLESALNDTGTGAVWVAAGTYRLSANTASFTFGGGLFLYGGFNGTETSVSQRNPTTNVTILSGDVNGDDVAGTFSTGRTDNAAHVVVVNPGSPGNTALIDGFTISGGNAAGTGAPINTSGGGVFVNGQLKMHRCKVVDNFATTGTGIYLAPTADESEISTSQISSNYGQAALYLRRVDNITVDSCTFENNINEIGTTNGGAFLAFSCQDVLVSNTDFIGNKSPSAGAFYCVMDSIPDMTDPERFVLSNCTFSANLNTLSGASGSGVGGAARFRNSSYSLIDCTFDNSTSVSSGGHIRNDNEAADNIIYTNTDFRFGVSGGWGGAFTAYGGTYAITGCEFEENTCPRLGGAVNNGFAGTMTYTDCVFMNNKADGTASGGALGLQNDGTTVNAINCNFLGNSTSGQGGAIFSGANLSSSPVNVDGCLFEGNVAAGFGGAIHMADAGPNNNATLNVSNSIFNFNSAADQGGALNVSSANTNITNCLFTNNIANPGDTPPAGRGGAIALNVDSTTLDVVIMNSTFAYNVGEFSAGISNWVDTSFAASSNTVLQNNIFISDGLPNYGIENGDPVITSNGGNLFDDESFETQLTNPKDLQVDDSAGLFVDANDDNYRLQNDAPAVDAGVDAGAPPLDIEGNPRLDEVDMGAYENQFVSKDNEVLVENNGQLAVRPNPVLGETTVISLDMAWTGTVELRLTNMFGQVLRSYQLEKTTAQMTYELNVANLANGIYHLAASNGTQVLVTPLIKN